MAKESGLGMALAIDDSGGSARTISNDVTNFDFAIPRGTQDVTGIDKSANERLLLLADFSISVNGVFNDGSNASHDVFKTVSSTSVARTVTITVSGQSLPNETFFTDYSLSRSATGELTYSAPGVLTGGTVPTWA
tara:strand:- start:4067 stop:4471 length:405 start_codon:yes stop_codon:yes gene_type:complete